MHAARAALKMSLKGKCVAVLIEHGGCSLEKEKHELSLLQSLNLVPFVLFPGKQSRGGKKRGEGEKKAFDINTK